MTTAIALGVLAPVVKTDFVDQAEGKPLGLVEGHYDFAYDYPLEKEATFSHLLTPATTARDLLAIAREDYARIYREEERGKRWGIWGHPMTDLWVEGVHIDVEWKNVSFTMGS